MIRRAIGTTLAGLCALTGPLAGGAFAATGDELTTSVTSARPGVAFTVSPTAAAGGCPSASGAQTVDLTFTDSAGTVHFVGSVDTADDGSWADAPAALSVAGLDNLGTWSNFPVAAGAGTLAATCLTAEDDSDADDPGDDSSDDSSDDSTDPGDDSTDPGDDSTDPGDDDATDPGDDADDPGTENPITRSYPGVAFTATGTAPKLSLSASVLKPSESVTVTPGEACSATGTSTVTVSLVSLSDPAGDGDSEEDNPGDDTGDDGDEDGSDDPGVDDGLPRATVTSSTTGTWTPVTLALPADLPTGDYAVTAACGDTGDTVTSSYDAQPLAVGTVLISAAICTAKSVSVNLTGSYSGEIIGKDSALPAKLALTGEGPWKIKVRSQTTGQQLAARNVACAKPLYELGVTKTGLSSANKPQARACNTGRAPVTAVLTVLSGKKYQKADKEALDPAECAWLQGAKLDKGEQVKAQVLIDAPGKSADDVVESFTVKRSKR